MRSKAEFDHAKDSLANALQRIRTSIIANKDMLNRAMDTNVEDYLSHFDESTVIYDERAGHLRIDVAHYQFVLQTKPELTKRDRLGTIDTFLIVKDETVLNSERCTLEPVPNCRLFMYNNGTVRVGTHAQGVSFVQSFIYQLMLFIQQREFENEPAQLQ